MFKRNNDFFESEEGQEIRQKLQFMTVDKAFNTKSSYTADSTHYPDNLMPFVDKHMNYLQLHPDLNASIYIANVRLMTRLR